MSLETTAILRSILYQAEKADTKGEIIRAIKAMCSEEDIALIEKLVAEDKKIKKEESEK